jgi:hypothetical protein
MEEQKYYTPVPEDIRPGIVYEHKRWIDGEDIGWATRIMPANGIVIQNILERMKRENVTVRIPLLTGDQIEAEGWEIDEEFPATDGQILPYILRFGNDHTSWHYHLWHNPEDDGMEITRYHGRDMYTVFKGWCRCINDFRLIVRLCNII